jgi:5'-nucleotidase (lipoprotein e(P4) family)
MFGANVPDQAFRFDYFCLIMTKPMNLYLHIGISLMLLFSAAFESCKRTSATSGGEVSPSAVNEHMQLAVLYHQKAGECRALCYQAFNTARMMLDADLRRAGLTLQQAIVIDIDDTALDNAPYEGTAVLDDLLFPAGWNDWVEAAKAKAIPGAIDFLRYAESKGIVVYYISNRAQMNLEATIKNLSDLGFPYADEEHVMLKTDQSSKKGRFDKVAAKHRIVMMIGDNLNDFSEVFERVSVERRFACVDSLRENFGRNFIVLPNAMYGDWLRALYGYNDKLSEQEKAEIRRKSLEGF